MNLIHTYNVRSFSMILLKSHIEVSEQYRSKTNNIEQNKTYKDNTIQFDEI